ncbi:BTB/POZ domain-containing protein 17-like [Amphiura filiformis]|uniref:BTB/POZ domain-containing protein 17-like n=1 Tax=Amphiura filiformis TaxID=82378 RepID=UPI003B21327D
MESFKTRNGTTLGSVFDFVGGLSRYCNNPELSDVTVKVGESTFYCHKFFLASASDVFRTMLTGPQWSDSRSGEIKLEETPECQAVFGDFLQCLYSGQVTVTTTTIMPIFTLADKYNIRQLRSLCERYMTEQIGQGNIKGALEWLSFAETYNLHQLVSHCYSVIRSNLLRIIDSDAWLKLTVDQMCFLLSGSQLVVRDEYTLYKALERWMMKDAHRFGVAQCLRKVTPLVRFAQISSEQILDIEKSEFGQIYQKQLKDFILEGYKFHALSAMTDMFTADRYMPRLYLSAPHCQVINVHPSSTVMANAMQVGYRPKSCGPWYLQVQQNGKSGGDSPYSSSEGQYATPAANDKGNLVSVIYKVQAPNNDTGKSFKLAIASFDVNDKFHCAVTHAGKVYKPDVPTANVHWSLTTNVTTLHSQAFLDKTTSKVKLGVIIQVE